MVRYLDNQFENGCQFRCRKAEKLAHSKVRTLYNTGLTSTSLVSLKDSLCPSVKHWHIAQRLTTTSAGRTVWPINSTIPIPMVPPIKPKSHGLLLPYRYQSIVSHDS